MRCSGARIVRSIGCQRRFEVASGWDFVRALFGRRRKVGFAGMQGELNTFQRAMLQWNALRPYNAVHVVRMAVPLEMDRLRQVLETLLGFGNEHFRLLLSCERVRRTRRIAAPGARFRSREARTAPECEP